MRHIVVDEVDRMVERGHFEELQLIVNYIQTHSRWAGLAESFCYCEVVHPGAVVPCLRLSSTSFVLLSSSLISCVFCVLL